MSRRHPIISVTGSSGSGTTTVRHTFEQIFRRESIRAAYIEGDGFHRHNRAEMAAEVERRLVAGDATFSHFSHEANELARLADVFRRYGATGEGETRSYAHDDAEAERLGIAPGEMTDWHPFEAGTDLLFYEGLHGAVRTDEIDIACHADLRIGVVPVINLEWIQKAHRDRERRGSSIDEVREVVLRRMHAYVHDVCPQFSETDINFQRVPVVDTSNPFVARWIPTAGESLVVIRFRDPGGIDFAYLVQMIAGSWMTRANSIVIPGDKLDLAMQLILTPIILRLIARAREDLDG